MYETSSKRTSLNFRNLYVRNNLKPSDESLEKGRNRDHGFSTHPHTLVSLLKHDQQSVESEKQQPNFWSRAIRRVREKKQNWSTSCLRWTPVPKKVCSIHKKKKFNSLAYIWVTLISLEKFFDEKNINRKGHMVSRKTYAQCTGYW